jgi:GTP-binding protein
VAEDEGDVEGSFQMLVSSIDYNDYLGRIAIGKISRGAIHLKDSYTLIKRSGDMEQFKISKLLAFEGLQKVETSSAVMGDIIGIAGMKDVDIGETIAESSNPEALPVIEIDVANTSPFAGKEGKFVTSRQLRERLFKEVKSNVSLRVSTTEAQDTFKVSGRGELHLTILIETMRREGFEFSISRPEVVMKEEDGKKLEPEEFITLDLEEAYMGTVMETMGKRKGSLKNMAPMGEGSLRLEFVVPTRGLFGFTSEFLTLTKGTGIINRNFHNFIPYCGEIASRINGVLISMETGKTTGFSLFNLQERGSLLVGPGQQVYLGQIVGENNKDNDLVVNVCKEKKLTNMRASGSDVNVILTPPKVMSLEQILGFLNEDELAEITPTSIRLRKRLLDENDRKRNSRSSKAAVG